MIRISDAHFRAIGRIAVNFASVEMTLGALAGRLLRVEDHVGMIVTSQLSFRRLLDMAEALVLYRFGEDSQEAAELRDVLRLAEKVEKERNIVFHSAWAPYLHAGGEPSVDSPVYRLKVTARGELKGNVGKDVKPEELEALANRIEDVILRLVTFMEAYAPRTEQGV